MIKPLSSKDTGLSKMSPEAIAVWSADTVFVSASVFSDESIRIFSSARKDGSIKPHGRLNSLCRLTSNTNGLPVVLHQRLSRTLLLEESSLTGPNFIPPESVNLAPNIVQFCWFKRFKISVKTGIPFSLELL